MRRSMPASGGLRAGCLCAETLFRSRFPDDTFHRFRRDPPRGLNLLQASSELGDGARFRIPLLSRSPNGPVRSPKTSGRIPTMAQ